MRSTLEGPSTLSQNSDLTSFSDFDFSFFTRFFSRNSEFDYFLSQFLTIFLPDFDFLFFLGFDLFFGQNSDFDFSLRFRFGDAGDLSSGRLMRSTCEVGSLYTVYKYCGYFYYCCTILY